jgi:hypothetical protein
MSDILHEMAKAIHAAAALSVLLTSDPPAKPQPLER